jgi:hypothetical protein
MHEKRDTRFSYLVIKWPYIPAIGGTFIRGIELTGFEISLLD